MTVLFRISDRDKPVYPLPADVLKGGSSLAFQECDYLMFSAWQSFGKPRSASAAGRNLAGLETGTVSRKSFRSNARSLLSIESSEGSRNLLKSRKILLASYGSSTQGK
jgi:hypothetical protein